MSSPSGQPVYEQEIIEEGSNHGPTASGSSAPSPASGSPYCIFKIPEYLTHDRNNSYGYQPSIVSIGPYHHGKPNLKWVEGEKQKFLILFLSKAKVKKETLVAAVAAKEMEIRASFFDIPEGVVDTNLIDIMVLDGCFLLTLILAIAEGRFPMESQIFSMPWALSSIRRDLLLLENQIPMFVLKTLLDTAIFPWKTALYNIALCFFKDSFKNRRRPCAENFGDPRSMHLLDLIRQTFIPIPPQSQVSRANKIASDAKNEMSDTSIAMPPPSNHSPEPKFLKLKLSAKELCKTGVKIKLKKNAQTFLNISFKEGVIQIPEIILDDFLSVVLLNCIAFEQFYPSRSTHVTSYAMFMGCLISSERDATYLVEKGIIQNYLGTEDEVSLFFKRILNDYVFDIEKSYLADVIKDVDEYSSNDFNMLWENCKQIYMASPWIFLSKVAAGALLALTIAQVVLAATALK